MPLTELIRYFNAADRDGDSTLYAAGRRVAAWHRGLKLASRFRPVVDLAQERIVGHVASLDVTDEYGSPLDREAACARQESGPAIVHFDRLCRTLHALNFLAQQDRVGGWLQMAVHPRHLLAVPGQHGLVYEAILKRCGLAPEDIVLSVDAGSADDPHLQAALVSYRRRGYRLALTASDDPAALKRQLELRPDILRVTLAQAGMVRPAAASAGIVLETSGVENRQHLTAVRASGIALGSGRLFGDVAENCRPTHTPSTLAYNSPSSSGVHHENRP